MLCYYTPYCTCHCTVCYCHRRCPFCGLVDAHYTWCANYPTIPNIVITNPTTIVIKQLPQKTLGKKRSNLDW